MRYLTFLITAVLICTTAHAQCGEHAERIGATKPVMLDNPVHLTASMIYHPADSTFYLTLQPQFLDPIKIDSGTAIRIVLEDETTLTLKVRQTSTAEQGQGGMFDDGGSSRWVCPLLCYVRGSAVRQLKDQKVNSISIQGNTYLARGHERSTISDWIKCEKGGK